MLRHRLLLALPVLLATTLPGRATATLACSIDDRNLTFAMLGNVGRSEASTVQFQNGSVRIKARAAGVDKPEVALEASHLRQQWTFERQLRLLFRVENDSGVGFTLALMTRETSENHYEGRYLLKIDGPNGVKEIWGRAKDCEFG